MVIVPKRVIAMLYTEGYFAEFWRIVQEGHTHVEAYLQTEAQLREYGFPGRYESYESFKNGKSRYGNQGPTNTDILFW